MYEQVARFATCMPLPASAVYSLCWTLELALLTYISVELVGILESHIIIIIMEWWHRSQLESTQNVIL